MLDATGRVATAHPDVDLISSAAVRFVSSAPPFRPAAFDAVLAGLAPADASLGLWLRLLRPGGRLIAAATDAEQAAWLDRLEQAGYIHLYSERAASGVLVRAERPPEQPRPIDRIAAVAGGETEAAGLRFIAPGAAGHELPGRYVHLLIAQSPNKPPWRLGPDDRLEWRAAVALAPGQPAAAPAFTSLVRAVRFMQAAILAGAIQGVNKVGKFPAAAAGEWAFGLVLDADFDQWSTGPWAASGWRWEMVDWRTAVEDEK